MFSVRDWLFLFISFVRIKLAKTKMFYFGLNQPFQVDYSPLMYLKYKKEIGFIETKINV